MGPEAESSPQSKALDPGPTLYLVATPIGNLEDITLRALRVLKGVDLIACEDTRQTQKLLNHYGITTRISDPGFRLITLAIRRQVPVVPIPGASAFLAGLVASGLPSDSFRFSGFLPAKRGERRSFLESIRTSPRTQVLYEAPHRLIGTVEDIVEVLGRERHIVIAREVTKLHEEFLRGRADELLETLKTRGEVKGEITLLIAKAEETARTQAPRRWSVRQQVEQIMSQESVDEKTALKKVAKQMGVSKSEAYRELQRNK